MEALNCRFYLITVDHDRNTDRAGGDHQNIDLVIGERFERTRSNTRARFHTRADQGDLCDVLIHKDL